MVELETPGSDPVAEITISDILAQRREQVRLWRQDNVLLGLNLVIVLAGLGLFLLLMVPLIARMQNASGMNLPALVAFDNWLSNGPAGLILVVALALLAIATFLLLRFHVQQNRYFYSEAGCPQCLEHDLMRVRRRRRDRILGAFGFPLYRFECRNCTWDGTRLSGIEQSIGYSEYQEAEEGEGGFQELDTPVSQNA